MSSSSDLTTYSVVTGLSSVTGKNYGRCLREHSQATGADYWLQTRQGGAHKDAEPTLRHHASFLLALGGGQPADGPAAVREFENLVRLTDETLVEVETPEGERSFVPVEGAASGKPPTTLRGLLEYLIDTLARTPKAMRDQLETAATAAHWTLSLSRETYIAAWITWQKMEQNARFVRWTYGAPQMALDVAPQVGPPPRARLGRLTHIPYSLIVVAAELWAATLARRGGLDLKPTGTAPTTEPSLERETPPPARGGATRDGHTNQSTEAEPGTTLNPEPMPRRARASTASDSEGLAPSITLERPSDHDRRSYTALAAVA